MKGFSSRLHHARLRRLTRTFPPLPYAFTTAIRRHLRTHETLRGHRRKLFNKSFGLSTPFGAPRHHVDQNSELVGMCGTGFEVRRERSGDCYWVMRDGAPLRYRMTNEHRGLTPISASSPIRNYALLPHRTELRYRGGSCRG